jgi:hypothetical protein
VDLDAIPLLDGARQCVEDGIFSSMQASNIRLKRSILNETPALLSHPVYALMFDPQVWEVDTFVWGNVDVYVDVDVDVYAYCVCMGNRVLCLLCLYGK